MQLGAVINAIVDALSELGVRHIEMPATPERVWRNIEQLPRGRSKASSNIKQGDIMGNIDRRCSEWPRVNTSRQNRRPPRSFRSPQRVFGGPLEPTKSNPAQSTIEDW